MKRILILALSTVLLLTGCQSSKATAAAAVDQTANSVAKTMLLATTTSTEQTGLLAAILPDFTQKTGIEVKVVAVGTGQAIEMGKNGEADVILVHAKASEEAFVKEGGGVERFDVMYNDFVLVGPKTDPLNIKTNFGLDINGAMKAILEGQETFVSRGDDSGTHKKELALWKGLALEPIGDWYASVGKGMGEVLLMADELQGYALSDRGTYLSMKDKLDLTIVTEKSKGLLNQYGVIAVSPTKYPEIHNAEANLFIEWLLSEETQKTIGEFGVEQYGEALFVPNAVKK